MNFRQKCFENGFTALTSGAALFSFLLLAAIALSLGYEARESFSQFGFGFLTSTEWDPGRDIYGALIPAAGTLITSAVALLIAVPVSFGIALYLTELAPGFIRKPCAVALELLAAVPSIIYGMWGLFVLAPIFQRTAEPFLIGTLGSLPVIGRFFSGTAFGVGLFTAGFVLSIMVIPYISSVMREVFSLVPPLLRESAYGIGCTTWETMRNVVLPYARNGVTGGIMLGLGRALGETMAVTFVIGNAFGVPVSVFDPSNSIASAIANGFNEAEGLQKSALIELGLILFLITSAVLAASRLMLKRMEAKEGKK